MFLNNWPNHCNFKVRRRLLMKIIKIKIELNYVCRFILATCAVGLRCCSSFHKLLTA